MSPLCPQWKCTRLPSMPSPPSRQEVAMSDDEFEAKVAKAKADLARDLKGVKRVSPTLCAGPGYFEIHGVRFYDDDVVIDRYGQPVIRKGKMEIHQDKEKFK